VYHHSLSLWDSTTQAIRKLPVSVRFKMRQREMKEIILGKGQPKP
jgi:hypothetical protein